MKRFNLFIILFFFFGSVSLYATEPDSVTTEKLKLANKLVLSDGHERAYQLYLECANAGNAYAMNATGVLMQRGWGTEQDEIGSIQWFKRAAAAGYEKAYYNLAQIYAKALGVEQNFSNAVNYLDTLQNTVHKSIALMWLGYYHYKGFGVEQNYETAVNFFLQSAEFDNADALYFLGLCYRNGYGVEQDDAEAQYYLSRAAELGHYNSYEELQEESTEIIQTPQRIAMKGGSSEYNEKIQIPREYRKIQRQKLDNNILGEYDGTIVMYDYSGKNIVKKSDLKIIFDYSNNGKIFGKWVENDTLFTDFEAILTDSTLQFLNTEYRHTERYSRSYAKKWKFKNATLEKTDTDSVSYLVGNIQHYDMKTKEPGKPMYISVQRNKYKTAGVNKNFCFISYPNPFDSEINIFFSLESEQNVTLSVYGTNGMLFDFQNLGTLSEGTHNYLLSLNAPQGQYLLVMQYGNNKISNLIIKK